MKTPFLKVVATPLERLIPFRKLQGAASLFFDARKLAHKAQQLPRATNLAVRTKTNPRAKIKNTGQ